MTPVDAVRAARSFERPPAKGSSPLRNANLSERMALGAAGGLAAACLLASLTWPFGWDQGIFAWIGSVVNDGGTPYRDAVDLKGPLPYFVYAAVQWTLGPNTWGIRLADAVALLAGAAVLKAIAGPFAGRAAGSWAACAFVLLYVGFGFWGTAQPDGWVGLLLTGAVALMLAGRHHAARTLSASLIIGITALVKPFYLGFLLLVVAHLWLPVLRPANAYGWPDLRRRAALTLLAVFAAAVPAIVAVVWFAHRNALDSAIEIYILYTAQAYSGFEGLQLRGRILGMARLLYRFPAVAFALPVAVAGVVAAWRMDRHATILLITWLALALMFVVLQNRFYTYHLIPALPPLVLFAAAGFRRLLTADSTVHLPAGGDSAVRALAVASLLMVAATLARTPVHDTQRALQYAVGRLPASDYYGGFAPMASFNAADEIEMADVLRTRSRPGERVAIIGYNAGLLYLAGRHSATRFGPSYPFAHDTSTSVGRALHDEFARSLQQAPPPWIVVGALDGAQLRLESRLQTNAGVAALVASDYCLDREVGHLVLFRYCAAE